MSAHLEGSFIINITYVRKPAEYSSISLPGSWLAARMADLTFDLQTSLHVSQGSTSLRFHSRRSLSVSVFHDILGSPDPHFQSICMSQAVLTAPLERSTCQNQRSLFPLRITSRSSISSCANSLFYMNNNHTQCQH